MSQLNISPLLRFLNPDENDRTNLKVIQFAADSDGIANAEDEVLTSEEAGSCRQRIQAEFQRIAAHRGRILGDTGRGRSILRDLHASPLLTHMIETAWAADGNSEDLSESEWDRVRDSLDRISSAEDILDQARVYSENLNRLERRSPINFFAASPEARRAPIDVEFLRNLPAACFEDAEFGEALQGLRNLARANPQNTNQPWRIEFAQVRQDDLGGDPLITETESERTMAMLRLATSQLRDMVAPDPVERNLQVSRQVLADLALMRSGYTARDEAYATSNPIVTAIDGILNVVTLGNALTGGHGYSETVRGFVEMHDRERGQALDALTEIIEHPPRNMHSDRSIPNALDYLYNHRDEFRVAGGRSYYDILTGVMFETRRIWELRNRRIVNADDVNRYFRDWMNFAQDLRGGTGSRWNPDAHNDGLANYAFARSILRSVRAVGNASPLAPQAHAMLQDSLGMDVLDEQGNVVELGGGSYLRPTRNFADEDVERIIPEIIVFAASLAMIGRTIYSGLLRAAANPQALSLRALFSRSTLTAAPRFASEPVRNTLIQRGTAGTIGLLGSAGMSSSLIRDGREQEIQNYDRGFMVLQRWQLQWQPHPRAPQNPASPSTENAEGALRI